MPVVLGLAESPQALGVNGGRRTALAIYDLARVDAGGDGMGGADQDMGHGARNFVAAGLDVGCHLARQGVAALVPDGPGSRVAVLVAEIGDEVFAVTSQG